MKNNKIKWGVIGSGGIARRRTIPEGIVSASNAEMVSLYDIDQKVNQTVATQYQAIACQTLEELLVSDVDAVYIATPVNLHLEQVAMAAKAGKHVLCEKPLGLNRQEAERMGEIGSRYGITIGTAYMMGFSAQHLAAQQLIQQGKLGKPVFGRAQLSCWYPPIEGAWRQQLSSSGGGSLMDMGSHCIDLLEMFFGVVTRVSCMIRNSVHSYQPEDSALLHLEFANGALGSVDSFFCIPDESSKNRLELYGSKGSILASGTIGQEASGEMMAYFKEEESGYDPGQRRVNGNGIVIQPVPVNTYQAEIEEFSNALLEQREPLNSFIRGLHSQYVLEACYESARSGRTISLGER